MMDEDQLEKLDHNSLIALATLVMRQVNVHQTTTHLAVLEALAESGDLEDWKSAFDHFPDVG